MAKKLILCLTLARLPQVKAPKIYCGFYLYQYLVVVLNYHPMQFKGKLMNQTWKTLFWARFLPKFGPQKSFS